MLKDRKIELSEQDLFIIDLYTKKKPADTMPQFGNPNYDFLSDSTGLQKARNQKHDNYLA